MHGDEVHLVLQLFNQGEFVVQLRLHRARNAIGVTLARANSGQAAQALSRAFCTVGAVRLGVAVQRTNFIQVKRATRRHFQRGTQQIRRVNIRQPHTLAQVCLGIGLQGKAAVVYGGAKANSRHHVMQRLA